MEFYRDKLFLENIVGLMFEARKKRQYLESTQLGDASHDPGVRAETIKYEKLERDLLDVGQGLYEDIQADNS